MPLPRNAIAFINEYGLDPGNRLIIYFAGHGHTELLPTGVRMGYIIPADTPAPDKDRKGFFSKALDMQMFESYAKRIQSKHALFVFDSWLTRASSLSTGCLNGFHLGF